MPFSSRVCLLCLQYLQEWSGMHRVCIPGDTLSESVALCLLSSCFVLLALYCKRDLFIHSIFLGLLGTSWSNTTPDWSLALQCTGSTVYVRTDKRVFLPSDDFISSSPAPLLFQGIFSWWEQAYSAVVFMLKVCVEALPCWLFWFFFQTCLSACFQRPGISTLCCDMCILDIALFSDFLLLAIFRKLSYN